jgi:hypothetical protein
MSAEEATRVWRFLLECDLGLGIGSRSVQSKVACAAGARCPSARAMVQVKMMGEEAW